MVTALTLGGCNNVPPASLEQAAAWQGTYAGTAVINDPALPGPVCAPQIPIAGFVVTGNQVSFGEFSGTIRNDDSLEMTFRRAWLTGRFVPNGFVGAMFVAPTEYCQYSVSLSRSP